MMNAKRLRFVLGLAAVSILCSGVSVALAASGHDATGAPRGVALPTDGPHTVPPWVWHHDLNPPAGPNDTPLGAGGTTGAIPFADRMIGFPWHMEFEIAGGPAGNLAGVLAVTVPGGGWAFPYPALLAGEKFTVAFPGPPTHAFNEIVWAEVPERGAWTITYTNLTAAALEVDGGISETKDLDGNVPPTEFDFGEEGPPPCDVLIELELTPIPAVSEWGMIVMVLLALTAGTVVFARWRRPTVA